MIRLQNIQKKAVKVMKRLASLPYEKRLSSSQDKVSYKPHHSTQVLERLQ